MKVKLNTSDPQSLEISRKKREFKKSLKKDKGISGKKSKKVKTLDTDADDEFERQLQDEVRMFLNNSDFGNDKSPKKESMKQINSDNDDDNNNIGEHKLLNQNKYATKLLKKTKLKQTNLNKLEERKKKKKRAMMLNNVDDQNDDSMSENHSGGKEKLTKKKLQRKNEDTPKSEGKINKKSGKLKDKIQMKQLFKEFDKMEIDQNSLTSTKKLRKKEKFLKLQENSENIDEWKKNKKLAKKMRKKEKQLKKRSDDKEKADLGNKTEEKVGKTKKFKKKRHEHDDDDCLPDKIKCKPSVDSVTSQIKRINLESTKENSNKNEKEKYKKKKGAKKNIEEFSDDVAAKNTQSSQGAVIPNVLASQSSVGRRKEKYFNSKHTPLREKLMNKLKAARFRYLNEQLYTSKSEESKDFFLKDPESFEAYHEGFKKQVSQWPINPVDVIIKSIEERDSQNRLIIADLGCGEAKLAAQLEQHKVHSLDLVAMNERVTPCDMTHTPLKSASVDVAVFCLSLMGTDLAACVKEANRVLKIGGEMKIAEVESRFADVKDFVKDIQKYGFEKKHVNLDFSIFVFMDFKKVSNLSKTKKKKLPPINLKPCLYKKR